MPTSAATAGSGAVDRRADQPLGEPQPLPLATSGSTSGTSSAFIPG